MGETKGITLLQLVRKKGVDFDRGGETDTLEQLVKIEGIFPLKDVMDRLPFPESTIRNWIYKEGSRYRSCFHLLPVGTSKSMALIDLNKFCQMLEDTLQKQEEKELKKTKKNQ